MKIEKELKKTPINSNWRRKFVEKVNWWIRFDSRHIKSHGMIRNHAIHLVLSLLGESFNFGRYGYKSGFERFCGDFGIDLEKLNYYNDKKYKRIWNKYNKIWKEVEKK